MLDYEKRDVYRIALEFVITTIEIRDRLPRGGGELVDSAQTRIVLDCTQHCRRRRQAQTGRKTMLFLNSARVGLGVWCSV
jgi:hypothetical protein